MKKILTRKIARPAITLLLVLLALLAIFRVWTYYTQSPWTRDARFRANVLAIAPDVAGLISEVAVRDNQPVQAGQVLFVVDQRRYAQAKAQAQADVDYYQALVNERQREARRRNTLGVNAVSREQIDLANNQLQTASYQLAKAKAALSLAEIDLQRTVVRAPVAGWITNLHVYAGEFITRGASAVALVQQGSFYVQAYLEETKLARVRTGDRAQITPLGSDQVLMGTVDSIAAGVASVGNQRNDKGIATVDSNLEWVRLAQRVPVRIRFDQQPGNRYPAGTTATVVITDPAERVVREGWFNTLLRRLRELG